MSSSPGQYIINFNSNNGPLDIEITATDPQKTGNYIRKISVVPSASQSAYASGQIFNLTFLSLLQNFHAFRFIDWFNTNTNPLSSWANRPMPATAFWGGLYGVPLEVAINLANALSADAWLNIPTYADSNYVAQMATLVHVRFGTHRRYTSNTVTKFGTAHSCNMDTVSPRARCVCAWSGQRQRLQPQLVRHACGTHLRHLEGHLGCRLEPCRLSARCSRFRDLFGHGIPQDAVLDRHWQRTASAHAINAIAIAPYFGYSGVPVAWITQSDGGSGHATSVPHYAK